MSLKSPSAGSSHSLDCIVCVMGVSGCGKSTVAELIATHFAVPFCEADALHPQINIEKMAAGIPLHDEDREPWLYRVRDEIKRLSAGQGGSSNQGCVVACSALKEHYREILKSTPLPVVFVHLVGSFEAISARMATRDGHFMPASLLRSQFDTLQAPLPGPSVIELSIERSPETIAMEAAQLLSSKKFSINSR